MNRILLCLLIALFAVAAFSGHASAQAIINEGLETAFLYVDGALGSDSNPGTQSLPLKTIGAAIDIAVANNQNSIGTKITVNPGTYREALSFGDNPRETSLPITLQAATTGSVIVSGGTVYTGWTKDTANANRYTHSWTNTWTTCPQIGGSCPDMNDVGLRKEMIFVNGTLLTQVLTLAAMQQGTFFIDSANAQVYIWPANGTNIGNATVEVAQTPILLEVAGYSNLVVRGIVFQYANTCRGNAAVEVYSGSTNVLFDSDTFQWNNGQGLAIITPATSFTVMNSTAVHNGDSGFHEATTQFGLWQSNTTSYNNWRGALAGYYACNVSGFHVWQAHNDTIDGMTVTFNQTYGIHWDTDNAFITTSGIVAANNLMNGLYTETSQGPITFDSAYSCNHNSPMAVGGLVLRNAENISLTNSTLVNNTHQIGMVGVKGGIQITDWVTGQTLNLISQDFVNTGNVIQGNDASQTVFHNSYLDGSDWTTFQSTLVSNNNTWWHATNPTPYTVPEPTNGTDTDFTGWQDTVLQDATSVFAQPAGNPAAACTFTPQTDFWFTVDNYTVTSDAAGNATLNYTLTPLNFSGPVTLTVDGISSVPGLSGAPSPSSITTSGSAVLTVSAATTTVPGTYPITILANNGSTTRAVTSLLTVPSGQVRLSAVSVDFGTVIKNSTSTQTVTLTNYGTTSLTVTSVALSGATSYTQTNTCGASVKAGKNCTITITFAPTSTGTKNGTLTITDSDVSGTQSVSLTGVVNAIPTATVSPSSLTFASQGINTTSTAQTVTLTNTSSASSLTINSITLTGTNPGDYAQTNNCGSSLAAGAACTVNITFTPTASGSRKGTLTISNNTSAGSSTASLTGTGTYATATVSPSSLTFASQGVGTSSPVQKVTLSNTSTSVALQIGGVSLSGANASEYSQTNTCGSSLAAGASCTVSVTFTPSASGTRTATLTITDATSTGSHTVSLTGTGTYATDTLAPLSLTFASQTIGTTSASQKVTLTNTGSVQLNVKSITFSGTNAGEFSQTNTCGSSVAVGASCNINVSFTPAASGSRTATLNVATNTATGTQTVSLNGTGASAQATATLTPTSVTFSSQGVGTTSAAKALTLKNTSATARLTITSIALTGANPADFAQTNNCGTSLGAGLSCIVTVTFTPSASGSRTATVTVTDNVSAGSTTSSITGTGTYATDTLTPSSLTFAGQNIGTTSAPQNVTLTNTGTVQLNINSITFTGANAAEFAQTNLCGANLSVGGSCTISVTFTPTASGSRTATLSVATNTSAGSQTVSLTGTGNSNTPTATLTPASYDYGNQAIGVTSASQVFTLTNTGTVQLSITSTLLSGGNRTDFKQTNTCDQTLAAGASCTITVTFTPSATGLRTTTIKVTDNTSAGSNTAALSGTGVYPTATLAPASLTFASQTVGSTSAPQNVTMTNSGTVPVTVNSIALSGANSTEYAQTNTCGASVAVGASCSISVTFTPAASGSRTATLTVSNNTQAGSQTVSLRGTGSSVPTATLAPSSLTFASQGVGSTSAAQNLTLSNTSASSTLNITSITFTGANSAEFAQTNTCGASVAAGATCTISVTFTPASSGSRTATLTVNDNAASPQTGSLTGTGVYSTFSLSPVPLAFGNQKVGTTSAAKIVTLTNTGTVTVTLTAIRLTGANATEFAQTNNCGSSVPVGGSCAINVTFTPRASGTRTATLATSDNSSSGAHVDTVTGTGTP